MSFVSIENLLSELNLDGALESFRSFTGNPNKLNDTSWEVLLESMLINEKNTRESRRQSTMLRMARLPLPVAETSISYDEVRGTLFKERMTRALSMDFVDKGQNITIFGNAGSGKTYVACALARKNCMRGKSTIYYNTADLIREMHLSYGSPSYISKLKILNNRTLLVLDDFCLTKIEEKEQSILFDIISKRYGRASTIIVSQKMPDAWLDMLGHTSLAESIVERCANNNFIITMQGESRRRPLDLED